ncbi:MAG: lysophospholipid acyltransferase family protein [Steroidobacteraceae bacterium]
MPAESSDFQLQAQPSNPFQLHTPWQQLPGVGRLLNAAATHALALTPLTRVYQALEHCRSTAEFAGNALQIMGVGKQIEATDLLRIPTQGAAIVVANHPYGGLEGLLLIELLLQRRADVRVLANHLLWRIPELRPVLIPVDVLDASRKIANLAGLRAAIAHVKTGGLLAMFPAGAVSHLHGTQIVDPAWNPTAARLIRKCNAPVTPIHFAGHNSTGFQLAGMIHPLLRTAMLPRELVNKRNHRIQVSVGNALPASQIQTVTDDTALASLLRLHTYALARPATKHSGTHRKRQTAGIKPLNAVADAISPTLVAAELAALPQEQHLLDAGGLRVVYAQAAQLPWSLQELGRLRELTFRAVGEGTGHALDIDLFDNYYTHLICWNPATKEIVGGYRIGMVDQILKHYGLRGLYTHTLFKFGRELTNHPDMAQGMALELGRSFVRPEYQRSFTPLLALWRGISAYVVRHPQYRVLFGPVSISNDYLPASRLMLVEFLKRHCFDAELSRLIKPRTPVRRRHPLTSLGKDFAQLSDLDMVSALLSQLEPDQKGVPVLLRQYLKLGGKLLGFNLDTQFGDAIDGLIMVDLLHTDLKTLQRYMGKEEAVAYLARHAATTRTGSIN